MRKSSVKPSVCCGLSMSPELYAKVKVMANEHDCSVNAMIKGILEEAVRVRHAISGGTSVRGNNAAISDKKRNNKQGE